MRKWIKRCLLYSGLLAMGVVFYLALPSVEPSQTRRPALLDDSFKRLDYERDIAEWGELYRFAGYDLEVHRLKQGSKTLIVCLPILSGEKILPQYFAQRMFDSGYDTAIIMRNRKLLESLSPENINETLVWMVDSHCTLIEEFSEEYSKIGIVGISLGGIMGTLIMGHCDKVDSLVTVVSGENLPEILIGSDDSGVVRKRNELLASMSLEELSARLERSITCDPRFIADRIDPKQVLLVLARYDKTVPYRLGVSLKERLGNPETITLPTDHYTGLLYLPYIKNRAIAHFGRTL